MITKRAIWAGIILWALILSEASILIFGFGLSRTSLLYYSIHYFLLIFISAIAAVTYFRGHIRAGAKQGLYLGLIMLAVGIVLDSIITIPLFLKFSYSFFLNLYLWVGMAETVLITTLVGIVKDRR